MFLSNNQIDVYPKLGKKGGAFCSYCLKTHPTYILLNYTEDLHDILTLAHELGHGINDELMKEKQNALNFGTPIFTAEVASTFMEDFVLEELLKKADDETKLSLMIMKLDEDISTILRQIACYKFELELHKEFKEKGYLSKEEIGKIFQKNMSDYMGPSIIQSPGSENWWVYWPHIRDFFYTYSYSSGLIISKALQAKVRNDTSFIEQVKEFLSTGLSKSPKDIFMKLGLDITKSDFWSLGLDEIERTLVEAEKLAKKLSKI
jgi:oligoendopeptidase F